MMSAQDSESYGDRPGETVKQITDVPVEVVHRKTPSIQDLPEEVFEMIIELLPERDLYTCSNVCVAWRCILNQDRFWKKHCKYPEKFFKLSSSQVDKRSKSSGTCKWKKNCLLQTDVWENWRTGKFVTRKIGIGLNKIGINKLSDMVDEQGNHWLFNHYQETTTIWNLTVKPFIHCKHKNNLPCYSDVKALQDKLVMFNCYGHVRVYEFKHPEYALQFSGGFSLPSNTDYRLILVDSRFIIAFRLYDYVDMGKSIFIWDLNSGRHVTTVEQREIDGSFVSVINSKTGFANSSAIRLMYLAPGDNGRFIVFLSDNENNLCQMSLYSITEMKFVKVLAQLEGIISWFHTKGDIVVICNLVGVNMSEILLFNINTGCIGKFDYPSAIVSDEHLIFDDDKVIFKVKNCIHTVTLIKNLKVHKSEFEICENLRIVKYFYPRFLLLKDCSIDDTRNCDMVSVWDTDAGLKLWDFPPLSHLYIYRPILKNLNYPGRLLVRLASEKQFSILKFDVPVH